MGSRSRVPVVLARLLVNLPSVFIAGFSGEILSGDLITYTRSCPDGVAIGLSRTDRCKEEYVLQGTMCRLGNFYF